MCIRDRYNLSYQANSACKEAIEQAISAHYAENRLDTEAAVKDVLEKFGTERVQFILANTIPVSYTHLDVYKRQISLLAA